jgi:hypothetical protein
VCFDIAGAEDDRDGGKINTEFPTLDESVVWVHRKRVQAIISKFAWALAVALTGTAAAQESSEATAGGVPPEVIASAKAAVVKLGQDVTRGEFRAAIERMNPQWRKRLAGRTPGGEPELLRRVDETAKAMARQGVSVVSCVVGPEPCQAFEVGIGKQQVRNPQGEMIEVQVHTQWLVLVPTVTRYRQVRLDDPKAPPLVVEKTGFQVAVADKGKDNWTFIDGSGLSVSELRREFVNLPQDLKLPPVRSREIK